MPVAVSGKSPAARSLSSNKGKQGSHAHLRRGVTHLQAVYQRSAAANRARHVHGFGHLLQVGTFFKTRLRVCIDAIRALHRMSHPKGDQALFTLSQSAFGEHCAIPLRKLTPQFWSCLLYTSPSPRDGLL